MTLFLFSELSQTPNRVAPGFWAQLGVAETSAAVRTAAQTVNIRTRIRLTPLLAGSSRNGARQHTESRHRPATRTMAARPVHATQGSDRTAWLGPGVAVRRRPFYR